MRWLSDTTIQHLRSVAELPDLTGTRYRLEREIARGGMGVVYLAEDTELARPVALKVLAGALSTAEAAARMKREAHILARLEHPGVVPVHDVGRLPDGRVFYAMKLVRGSSLHRIAANAAPAELLRIFLRVCEAVAYAHANGVIHRDLKPENIMVGQFGEVLVMDWGVAKLLNLEEAPLPASGVPRQALAGTASGTIVGTPGYMSPEQTRGDIEDIDARSDVYALGAMLKYVLTQDVGRGTPDIPKALGAIWQKAMAQRKEERYSSAGELAEDIARYLDGEAVRAHRETVPEKVVRFVSRHRVAVTVIAAYLVMRVVLLLWMGR